MPRIIAFGHKKGVGKNTAAKFLDIIIRTIMPQLVVKNASFADKLKDISFQLFAWAGLKRGIYYETHYAEKEKILPLIGMTPREIWIGVGNKLREVSPSVWVDYVLKGIKADIVIISDLRFQNEVSAVKAVGGIVIRIDRDGLPQGTDLAEVDLDNFVGWDCTIPNNGSLDDLNNYLERLILPFFILETR